MSDMLYYHNRQMGLTYRYKDIIRPPEKARRDNRSGTEIAREVITGLRLQPGPGKGG